MPAGRPKGYPKTGGRKKGSKNKRTREFDKHVRKGELPLDFLLRLMRDKNVNLVLRSDAAKAAIPYLHARRAPEDSKGRTIPPMVYTHPNLEQEDGSELVH